MLAFMDAVVWATVRGPITQSVGDTLLRRVLDLVRVHEAERVLLDFRAAGLVGGVVRLIQRVNQVDGEPALRKARTAIVCTVRNNDYAFLESAAAQRGLPIRVFTDGARAQAWLHESTDH